MLNINILNDKYKRLLPIDLNNKNQVENFNKSFKNYKSQLSNIIKNLIKENKPILLYNQGNNKNALFYLLNLYFSLDKDKILDYQIATGQTFINQHFADKDRDKELYESIYYTDVLYITLSQFDYTSDYLESLIIDLIEFRYNYNKPTIIYYEILGEKINYQTITKKLNDYFNQNKYFVITLDNKSTITSSNNSPITSKHNAITKKTNRKARII